VRNAGLPGWRPDEIESIAALVRYHRKAMPKPTHPEWAAASPAARAKIEGLAALLRIADGLDRRHLGVVTTVRPSVEAGTVRFAVEALQDVSSEIAGATFKADLFTRAFGLGVSFDVTVRENYGSSFGEREPGAADIDAASLPR
jgi:exopolyphosphatase/guanosine-5'-triphosphate,3'-diphosphate pyrophosphatase